MKVLFLTKRKIGFFLGVLVLGAAAFFIGNSLWWNDTTPTLSESVNAETRVINLVTGEFKSKTADGKELEAYRWDPGTIYVEKGEQFRLSIYGVNGKEHPFTIEGTDVKGVVKKGEETIVDLKFDEEGVYRLICQTHADIQSNGPMIAYIVVD
ncbi:cupredoxin domain-containing protein [Halobacillus amylolyticus]|uniref:Cupredoxin domain-containing protein n=1 Tax=Halobacillus amylolyticus TaxID=2932259 RepID=A0ABY4H8T2_9BACI|nr:cupredoxin domain-containing protein [Halobacillus amylolyticus]UOR10951.1 cupredoxin domain-containing protein [Halobacillus amylolyticus]